MAKKIVTVIVYSEAAATPGDPQSLISRDPETIINPDPNGDLYFVDDRAGLETVSEWRATNVIGFANSPSPTS
jgi:hypothetical protein